MDVGKPPPLGAAGLGQAPAGPTSPLQPPAPGQPTPLQLLASGAPMTPLPMLADPDPGPDAASSGGEGPVTAASVTASVHIQPLDTVGALQILIAEVRAALPLPGDTPNAGPSPSMPGFTLPQASALVPAGLSLAPTVATAPQSVVQIFLQSLPDAQTHPPAAWSAAASQLEGALDLALGKGVDAVSSWRDVPATVIEAAQETRTAVLVALSDELPNPLMLRPEWLGFAPRLEYFRRRRRYARRLSDPDATDRWDDFAEREDSGAERR